MPESQFEIRRRVLNELRTPTGMMRCLEDNDADASGLDFDFASVSTQAATTTLDDDSIVSFHQQQRRKPSLKAS